MSRTIDSQASVLQESVVRASHCEQLVESIIRRWDAGEQADAEAALRQHPDLAGFRSAVVELAYEEYCQRVERGETVDADRFCERFADHVSPLKRLLVLHGAVGLPGPHWPAIDERPRPGELFRGFALVDELGRGAFSCVYLASDTSLAARPVALKLTTRPGREPDVLGRLSHPHIVPVHAVFPGGREDPTVVVMPYLGRATLEDVLVRIRRLPKSPSVPTGALITDVADAGFHELSPAEVPGTLPPRLAHRPLVEAEVWLLRAIADGLAAAHGKGFLHLDLKPSNVLLAVGGWPMLLDFNLARHTTDDSARIGGTVPYMAPEQLRSMLGAGSTAVEVDARTDVFAWGVVAYELLTGVYPFGDLDARQPAHVSIDELLKRQRTGPVPLRRRTHDVNPSLARLVESCLSFDATRRPQTIAAVVAALDHQLGLRSQTRRWASRRPRAATALATAAAALVAASALAVWSIPPFDQRRLAAAERAYAAGDRKAAAAHIDEVLAVRPEHRAARLLHARIAVDRSDYATALADLKPVVAEGPSHAVDELYAYTLCGLHKYREAAQVYRERLAGAYASAATLNNWALCLIEELSFDEARPLLDQAAMCGDAPAAVFHNRAVTDLNRAYRDPKYMPLQGIHDAEEAQRRGGERGETAELAVMLYLAAGRLDPSWLDRVIPTLRQAVAWIGAPIHCRAKF